MIGLVSMRGRSLASSSSSSSKSVVLRLMQEQRSSDAKKAEATLAPTQLAIRSSFSHVTMLVGAAPVEFSIAEDGDQRNPRGEKRKIGKRTQEKGENGVGVGVGVVNYKWGLGGCFQLDFILVFWSFSI